MRDVVGLGLLLGVIAVALVVAVTMLWQLLGVMLGDVCIVVNEWGAYGFSPAQDGVCGG